MQCLLRAGGCAQCAMVGIMCIYVPHTQPLLCPSLQSIQSDGAKVDHNDPNIRARALQSQSSMEAGKAQVSHRFVRVVNMGTSLRPKKWISAPTSIGSRLVSECYHVHDDNRLISHTKWARRLTCVLAGKSSCEGLLHWPCYGYLKNIQESVFELIAALLGHRQDPHARSDVFEWLFLKPVACPKDA